MRAISGMEMVRRCRMVIGSSVGSGRSAPLSSETVRSMLLDDLLALVLAAVDEQPPGALGHVPSHDEDADGQDRAEAERQPPAQGRVEDLGVEEGDRQQRAGRGPDPERPVDRDVHPSAVLLGDELVDRRVDRCVLPTDAHPGDEPGDEVPQRGRRERRQDGREGVDAQGHQEELLAAEAVGQLTEQQGTQAGAGHVDRAGQPDVGAAEPEPGVVGLERLGHRADDGDLEAVEDPHRAQPDDDHPVPSGPGQSIHPSGDVGGDAPCLDV